jgi:hypothetical protein
LYISLPAKGYTAIILSNYDQAAENLESQVTDIMKGKDYEKPKLPFGEFLYYIYQKEGQEYFSANLKNLIKEKGVEIKHDGFLNNLGYQFLQNEPDRLIQCVPMILIRAQHQKESIDKTKSIFH